MRGTYRNKARHHPAVPNRAERIAFMVSTIPDTSATSIFKQLPYWDQVHSPPVGFEF
jgi:hypothetical protein